MKINWVEKLVKEGHVSAAARDEIYRDCAAILKVASPGVSQHANIRNLLEEALVHQVGANRAAAASALTPLQSGIVRTLNVGIGIGSILGLGMLGSKINSATKISGAVADIAKTKAELLQDPDFKAYPDKVDARIMEVTRIAPSVAGNPTLMKKLLKTRLQSGLTEQDVLALSSLQAQQSGAVGVPNNAFSTAVTAKMQKKSAARLGQMYADVLHIMEEATGEKLASPATAPRSFGDLLKHVTLLSSVPLLYGVGAGAVKEMVSARDRRVMGDKLEASFKKAISLADPTTSAVHTDLAKAREMFGALVHFAPHVASEPHAALAFMEATMVKNMGVHNSMLRELTDIERNLSSSRSGSPFFEGLARGTEVAGLPGIISKTITQATLPTQHEVKTDLHSLMGVGG